MTSSPDGAAGAARRLQIEAALAHYPDLPPERLAEVVHWFRKEASALDVALLATNDTIAGSYRRFRADHIDGLTSRDLLKGLAFAAVIAGIVVLIVWRAL